MPAFIDLPNTKIGGLTFTFAGWVAAQSERARIRVLANGRDLRFSYYARPDVEQAMPHHEGYITGVIAQADLLEFGSTDKLAFELRCDDEIAQAEVEVDSSLGARLASQADLRRSARNWCLDHLRCPHCSAEAGSMVIEYARIQCRKCRTVFPQSTRAINMISPELRISSNVVATENISSNPYEPAALELIQEVTRSGGWVLDCGAGSRPERTRNVINVEIVDYFSTDVLAVGERLPFTNDSFDGVVSLAVLEHVRDPFACARELLRVVRPGGRIVASVPFLQPVHGYPNHYYNMTQQGLRNLFEAGGEIEQCRVPLHGHPIFTLQWFLSEYLRGLPPATRAAFGNMTLAQMAAVSPAEFLANPAALELSVEAQNIVACLNTVIVRKR